MPTPALPAQKVVFTEDQQCLIKSSDGSLIPNPESYARTMTYNGDGTLATEAFTADTITFTRTYTYTAGNLTGISVWVRTGDVV